MTIFIFGWTIPLMLIKQQNTEKNHSLLLTENFNTVALIEINLYSVLFVYFFMQFLECSAKYTYCTWN